MGNAAPSLAKGSDTVIVHSNQPGASGSVVVSSATGDRSYPFVTGSGGSASVPITMADQTIGRPAQVTVHVGPQALCSTTFTPTLI
jgi:hypothetical protein